MKATAISRSLIGLSFVLTACRAVGPDYQKPTPPALSAEYGYHQNRQSIERHWWRNFHDPTLTELIETARRANFDISQAEAHIREARAIASGNGYANRSAELSNSTLVAGWELDLFGKLRRGQEAAEANVQASEALRDAMLMNVSAEVATAYLELRGSQLSIASATRAVAGAEKNFGFSQKAVRLGSATEIEATSAEQQLAEIRADLPLLQQSREIALARLAVLTGQAPGALDRKLERAAPIPTSPDRIAVGLPTDLLRNRPDVRAAERDLAAAIADIGGETADLYPRLSLGGTLSYSIGTPSGFLWNAGPNLSWAALNIPRVRTQIAAAQARADAALARYRQTVLRAAEEVTTSLSAWQHQKERRNQLRYAVALARTSSHQSQQRLQAGVLALPAVLVSERSLFNAESQLAESETATATSLVAVYKALGGGWER